MNMKEEVRYNIDVRYVECLEVFWICVLVFERKLGFVHCPLGFRAICIIKICALHVNITFSIMVKQSICCHEFYIPHMYYTVMLVNLTTENN